MATLEDVTSRVLGGLTNLTEERLHEIATLCDLSGDKLEKVKGRGRLGILRLVTSYLTGEELGEKEDGGMELLSKVLGKFGEWAKDEEGKRVKERKEEKKMKEDSSQTPASQPPTPYTPTEQMRKEFKIRGQIGDPGQKDKLPFSSLVHQIDRAIARGYPEEEITDAIINAMVPGLPLRGYLETKPGLNLPILRRLLRSHYREKEATELYHDLTRAVQDHKESPQEFLLRMLALRQKILFASKEADATFTYDATLVQGMFLHSLTTGISSENIKADLKPLLQDVKTTDEALLERINIAAHNENERQQKQAATKKVKVQEINTPTQKEEKPKREVSAPFNLQQMQEDIRAIVRSELAAVTQPPPPPPPLMQTTGPTNMPPERGPDWGCRNCRLAGRGPNCRHCFRCGGSDHYLRDCQQPRSGNLGGASERGTGFPRNSPGPQSL